VITCNQAPRREGSGGATAEALREWCKERMSSHKIPRYLKILRDPESFPCTASGKPQKCIKRQAANKELGLGGGGGLRATAAGAAACPVLPSAGPHGMVY
jgi:acyl-CoA synthetase (AMP-forming)/AMP-acid ligase II